MKTLIVSLLSCAAVLTLSVSCSTTKQSAPVQTADTYDSTPITAKKSQGQQSPLTDSQLSKALQSAAPVEMGSSSLFVYNMFNTDVNQADAYYSYYPKSDEVVIQLIGLQIKSYLLFDGKARSVLRQTVAQYESDFTGHTLDRNGDRYNAYGEFESHYKWGLLGPSNETKPKTSIGYKFVKNSPYFMLTMWPAEGVTHVDAQKDDVASSQRMTYFMNRKQAADMISFMDEAKISEITAGIKASAQKGDVY